MKKWKSYILLFATIIFGAVASGCGGGGRSAERTEIAVINPIGYPIPTLEDRTRNTAAFEDITYYLPAVNYYWHLYTGTAGENWISAVGTQAGLSASMSNPFSKVYFRVIPVTYNNPGTVTFYINGAQAGTLDLAAYAKSADYKEGIVNKYLIASGLSEDVVNTVTVVINSGIVHFDGWTMEYKQNLYHIDCGDTNTLEYDTLSETARIRDYIEAYAAEKRSYPQVASSTTVVDFLRATDITPGFTLPQNPFENRDMASSKEYSAGDYYYVSSATDTYTLIAYGGVDTMVTYEPLSAKTNYMDLVVTSPTKNSFSTSSSYVTIKGTYSDTTTEKYSPLYTEPTLSVTGGLGAMMSYPASGTFQADVALAEGVNDIQVKLTSAFGVSVYLPRKITKDTTAPAIRLIDPFPLIGEVGSQYANVYTQQATVSAYIEPGAKAYLNGTQVTLSSQGVFEKLLTFQPGDNTIEISASDAMNNSSSVTYTIKYVTP